MVDQPSLYKQKRQFSYYSKNVEQTAKNVISIYKKDNGDQEYEPLKAQDWTKKLATDITREIQNKKCLDETKFKLKVDVMILDKDSVGFHMSSSCLWDNEADGNISIQEDFESYYIIVSIFGFFRH
ncbi:UNKNOWN [Stylonychia lemnae]|uniref:Dynein light chain n=1 Tax=Stylonychia lemnae TaxID=5949 RepID=A0A077ZZA2_STYLE|nr:UNKNOWN [Stylonychia lemnae]|eukprot:CDW73823.1 UNKNOWN [Stylonychia lemnae]